MGEVDGELLTGADHEAAAQAAFVGLDMAGSVAAWERAYATYRRAGDDVGAVRAARALGYMYGAAVGDTAVMAGWVARAQTLLGDDTGSLEAGWVALTRGMFEADREHKELRFREALALARRHQAADLELTTLAYLGASLVHGDRTEEGMVLLDEALAGAAGGEVDDYQVLQDVFCQLFSACEHVHDVARADQWIRVGQGVADRLNLPSVAAFCNTHYGGILTAAGRWPEADVALTEAVRLWGLGLRSLRAGALVRLADLRVRQGRIEEAEALLDGLALDGDAEAARPVAAIHLARGHTALARDVLERALDGLDSGGTEAAPLLALLVDVHLGAGDLAAAAAAADALAAAAAGHPNDYLAAAAALAQGRVCLATGTGDPQACLRAALAGFARARTPMEVARSRLELATALVGERPEVALAEARAALDAFDRLAAARHADAAAALLRSLGGRAAPARPGNDVLTKREAEVLDLLGHGLSNPEIADRLYISRKTVEHHVANVLTKLGLRSRAEAAAYVVREGSAGK